jgi:hypothetical protein
MSPNKGVIRQNINAGVLICSLIIISKGTTNAGIGSIAQKRAVSYVLRNIFRNFIAVFT